MKTRRIVGQPPKMCRLDGTFLRMARDGESVSEDTYVTVASGGGFDRVETLHEFRQLGTRVRLLSRGCAQLYAVTELDVPE